MALPDPEPVYDLGSLAPDEPEEPVLDRGALAPDEAEEPVLDMGALAPDEPEEPVLDMGALAPDEPEEPVLDMSALAPDEPEEAVLDMSALAPDEPEEAVLDMSALAPDEPEEAVLDMCALAPDEPEEAVLDMGALAPDEPEFEPDEPVELPFLSSDEPDEIVIDLDALRPDRAGDEESGGPETIDAPAAAADMPAAAGGAWDDDDVERREDGLDPVDPDLASADSDQDDEPAGEPVYTRTLAELYVKQGAVGRALGVLRHLSAADPGNRELADRIAQIEEGTHLVAAPPEAGSDRRTWQPDESSDGVESEEEVESLARDLAQSGDQEHDVDSPFAWAEQELEAPPTDESSIRDYFDGLLSWDPEEER
jgi:hypothetical protein